MDTVWGETERNINVWLCQVETRFQQEAAGREESQALGSSGLEQDERATTELRTEVRKAKQSLYPKVERSEISNTGASPYSVCNTMCATSSIFMEHQLLFSKRDYWFHPQESNHM